jgi:hypothetical protein
MDKIQRSLEAFELQFKFVFLLAFDSLLKHLEQHGFNFQFWGVMQEKINLFEYYIHS